MGGLECVITGLMDEFKPTFDRWGITREIFTGMIVGVSFLVALGCVTPVSVIFIYLTNISLRISIFHSWSF